MPIRESVHQKTLDIRTRGRGLYDVTSAVAAVLDDAGVTIGLCSLFLQHTSASLVVQENADPAVLRDLDRWMARSAPDGAGYEHDAEGPDDMPAHIRAAITSTSLTIPITAGKLALGTWQAIYVWEHRTSPHTRRLVITVLGVSGDP
ncbi:secondary thiamine-phosphate synthase enzyme YjbQ [Polyangium sp. y55x31]|uniref:secondary thiamine-phosphate synthase enzyme YjbQ n=1 Tax=Polyangium sp. y55x31 TaxID=3042688 RepID=UPI00248265E8|nr:secondary thiamine-phosphate synthase enzyme YjbQ [Polyangium sp. y55x31]MDI1475009.1 secondary thiamine-phosphate synthase enzyme YjbQ [Polyangium sp. y55x31]